MRYRDSDRAARDAGITATWQRTDLLHFVRSLTDDELRAAPTWDRYVAGGAFAAAVDFIRRERGIRDGE